ncbi:hypothetical protein DEU34_2236 [Microbacterium sp. AG1240]|uniref:hypothetical protein n=1 Tax=Microbacterium sp. AG1240 TaxID=2183992 RepID=UPI000EAE60A6|nr:hypothetical protein [Microbacterium sp. AG1240]RKT33633.1 hypothetical protein DEU34_2236 [Microbacterium sp. AG1240]
MDLSETIAPKSDQLNADDLLSGPRTVTIVEVRAGSAEQPVELHLQGLDGRPYKPGKSMRRVLVAAWGGDGNMYAGRSMTLYTDPSVKFGGSEVGGIRISHLTHLSKPLSVNLTVTRGRRAPFVVQPLKIAQEAAPQDKIDAAVVAISKAQDAEKLAEIEAYADRIGVGREVAAELQRRRTELDR